MRTRSAILAVVCLAGLARAEPTPAELSIARQLFAESSALRAEARWAEAADKLRQALAVKETPGLRFHLAHCREQQGQLVEAETEYARADALIRGGAHAADVEGLLAPALATLRARIPRLAVRVPQGVREPRVFIDGHPVPPELAGTPMPLDPGAHVLVLESTSHGRSVLDLQLAEGEARIVEPPLGVPVISPRAAGALAAPPARRTTEVESSAFGPREWALVAEGVLTVAGLGVGIGFMVQRGHAGDRIQRILPAIPTDQTCDAPPANAMREPCAGLADALDERRAATDLATVGFAGAGVAVAAAVGTLLFWPTHSGTQVRVGPAGTTFTARF